MDDQIQRHVYCTVTKQGDEVVQCNDTSISSSFQIWFTFSYKRTFRFQIGEQDENIDEFQDITNNSLYVEPEEFSDERKTSELIYEALISWPICTHLREDLTSEVITRTRSIAESMPCGHHLLYIDVDVDAIYYRESQIMFDEILQQSIEENNNYMVPTIDSAIKSLERKRLDYKNYDCNNCIICLDKFSRRCRVTYMPCSHVFHGNCIETWLKTSHYCPVCRFEMPTSESYQSMKRPTSPETFDARGEL